MFVSADLARDLQAEAQTNTTYQSEFADARARVLASEQHEHCSYLLKAADATWKDGLVALEAGARAFASESRPFFRPQPHPPFPAFTQVRVSARSKGSLRRIPTRSRRPHRLPMLRLMRP